MNKCYICGTETKSKCSNCNQRFYCSAEHQKQDWKAHKKNCHPFKIEESEQLGRHLIATRNIKPFEIILKEAPLVRGPSQVTGPVCMGCLTGIEPSNYVTCDNCGWPLCGDECKNSMEHQAECQLTQKRGRKVNIQEFTNPHPLYQCVSTLRCLHLQQSSSENWEKLQSLESLEKVRRGSLQWKADLESIGKFIPKFFNSEDYDEDTIMKTVGILQTNGHEVPTSDPPHVAIYHSASLLEHSCIPNLAKSFTKEGHIVLWAPKQIKRNTHLSICYSDAVWGTADRQQHLMFTKLFKCSCPRCTDVTELGTNYSALNCENCDGLILPADPSDWSGDWSCGTCKIVKDKSFARGILEKAGKDVHTMEKNLDNCVKYITHYQKWLPRRHFHICEVKIQLVQLIGKDPRELMVIPDEKLNLKMEYARELVELYELLAPCEVRMLGTLCFELHSAIAENTRRISLQTSLSPQNLLEESLLYVEKCVNYLQHEPEIFIEGHILKQAKINRDALRIVMRM